MQKEEEKLVTQHTEMLREEEKVPARQAPLTDIKRPPANPRPARADSIVIEEVDHATSFPEPAPGRIAPAGNVSANPHSPKFKREAAPILQTAIKSCKPPIKIRNELNPEAKLLEHIKARKYSKEFFEKSRKEQIGLTTLVGPRRETTVIKFGKQEEEAGGQMKERPKEKEERPPSLDSNEQIPNMDTLLNTIDQNTSMKVKLEKAIIEFNSAPNKAFDFLWKEQIVLVPHINILLSLGRSPNWWPTSCC